MNKEKIHTVSSNTEQISGVNSMSLSSSGDLQLLLYDLIGRMGFEDVKASFSVLLEREEQMKKRKEILENHNNNHVISTVTKQKNGRSVLYYRTNIGGVDTTRRKREDLEDEIIKYYLKTDETICSKYDDFIKWRKTQVGNNTVKIDIRTFNLYISKSEFGNKPISKLNVNDAYRFIDYCKKIKPDMTKKYWTNQISNTMNMFFMYLKANQIRFDNPFDDIVITGKHFFTEPKSTKVSDQIYSKSEAIAVKALADKDGFEQNNTRALGISLEFNLGTRIGELCGLKWKDIETDENDQYVVHIQRQIISDTDEKGNSRGYIAKEYTKTKAGNRYLKLSDEAIAILRKIKQVNKEKGFPTEPDDYVFIRFYKGENTFCTQRSFHPRLTKYCKDVGMNVVKSIHDIRRTVITRMYHKIMHDKGTEANLKALQRFSGHSTLQQTLDYVKADSTDLTLPNEIIDNIYN